MVKISTWVAESWNDKNPYKPIIYDLIKILYPSKYM